ncbi:type IV pilus secretin PilQ family protein [Alteromonas sp. LMIT006]|uniref:type IV pilus secretin PilQ n=1 Tax=Alteromonadaceae TaxID=72275 RepID=UPI0020CA2D1F|nr:type IV pilus secretin PilQ family protein [Alteromonas sp. LMIT006]UTP72943.1 type IV pilus secretin PilQ family protein [Alteromonas sp. LMIT006]
MFRFSVFFGSLIAALALFAAPIFANTLLGVDYKRLNDQAGQITLTFSELPPRVNQVSEATQTSLTFRNTSMAPEQLVHIDVSQFATFVDALETFQESGSAKLVISHQKAATINQNQNGNQLLIDVIAKPEQALTAQLVAGYSGKPISLDFQDVPVRQVLQIIAQINGFNLVTTDTVNGAVTLNLNNVPWDQALDMILNIRGLDKRIQGNILLIAPRDELNAQEAAELQAQQQVQKLVPLSNKNIAVNYAKASDLATLLRSANGGLLSSRGSVAVDERTNTLLLRDTNDSIAAIETLLATLDVPVKQVRIESRMVTVRDNLDKQLGVQWGLTAQNGSFRTAGSAAANNATTIGGETDLSQRLNVSLPVTSPAGRIGLQVAKLMDGTILDLELSALESENKGEIIASPRITVANQQEAYIEQGTEIPYVQATSSGATSVEFKKAVLSLKVTPHITPDNRIILDLTVTQDTRGETVTTPTGPAVAIDTQEIKTQVLVQNGETVVLGGIFQQINTDDVAKVPVLGDMPIVGRLFKNEVNIEQKRELLIFVTPKIITD